MFKPLIIKWYRRLQKYYKTYPRTVASIKAGIMYALIFVACWQRLDPDFGWHLAAGNYIRQHWIPAHDIFTYTARNFRWIDHEWGNDVSVSWLYQWGGYGLLSAVYGAFWWGALCLFRNKIRLTILLIALLAFVPYIGVRTTVWSVLGVAILLELIQHHSKRARLFIPLLFLVWANLHGSFVIGFALIAYFGIMRRNWKYLGLLLICVVVTFINPYGPRLYVEIARTLFDPALHHEISEWRSFYLQSTTWPFIVLWAVGFWMFAKNKFKNWIGVAPIILLATASSTRYMPIFVTTALRDIDQYSERYKLPKNLDKPRKVIVGVFLLLVLIVIGYFSYQAYEPHGRESGYPQQAVVYLQAHGCPGGNLFNDYNYGGYLIWKLPSVPVFIDGRMPSWRLPSGQTYMENYYDLLKSPDQQKAEFARYNIRCALFATSPLNKQLNTDLTKAGWKTVLRANGSVLLMKS